MANRRGRILSRTASAAQGLRQRARRDSNAEFGLRRQGAPVIEWEKCEVAEVNENQIDDHKAALEVLLSFRGAL
jgi:hypothetical protein